jgi:hypothetical protein
MREDADAPADQRPIEPQRIGCGEKIDGDQHEVNEHVGREVDLESGIFQ